MNNNTRRWIRGGARVLGAIGGTIATPFTGGIVNPFTGYAAAGAAADALAPDQAVQKSKTSVNYVNPYNEGKKRGILDSVTDTQNYLGQDNQTFNKTMGIVDTAVAVAGVAANPTKVMDFATKTNSALGIGKTATTAGATIGKASEIKGISDALNFNANPTPLPDIASEASKVINPTSPLTISSTGTPPITSGSLMDIASTSHMNGIIKTPPTKFEDIFSKFIKPDFDLKNYINKAILSERINKL